MPTSLPPVRPLRLEEIRSARDRIATSIARTPLFHLQLGEKQPDIWLKLEVLQPTNSYKIRGAMNAIATLPEDLRRQGVWTISAGNAGQAIAYAARAAGIPCSVVVIETAPATKVARMQALGARLLPTPYASAWKALDERAFPGVHGTFIHPFDDDAFIIGHGTLGLEILEDLPAVRAVIAAVGGGGLVTGVASAVKALRPDVAVWGCEPETAAPLAESFAHREPRAFPGWRPSFVDGAGGMSIFPRMWERMRPLVDGSIVVPLEEAKHALRIIAEGARVVAEGAGALPLAAALSGQAGAGPIVAVVSGGNIDLGKLCQLLAAGN